MWINPWGKSSISTRTNNVRLCGERKETKSPFTVGHARIIILIREIPPFIFYEIGKEGRIDPPYLCKWAVFFLPCSANNGCHCSLISKLFWVMTTSPPFKCTALKAKGIYQFHLLIRFCLYRSIRQHRVLSFLFSPKQLNEESWAKRKWLAQWHQINLHEGRLKLSQTS